MAEEPAAKPTNYEAPAWLRSAKLGRGIVILMTGLVVGLECSAFYRGVGSAVEVAVDAVLLWAVWRGYFWARLVLGVLCMGVAVTLLNAGRWDLLRTVASIQAAVAVALCVVPGVGVFLAQRRAARSSRAAVGSLPG